MAFKVLAFAGVLLATQLACTAWAQPAQPSPAPRPSAERLRLARAVFEAQGGVANISATLDRAMEATPTNMPGDSTNAAANRRAARAVVQDVMRQFLPKILDAEANVYAETFDEHQLGDILAFYQSPTGQVLRDKLPDLGARSGAEMGKLMPAIVEGILDRLCSQTTCTPQQQQTLAALKQQAVSAGAP